jgi:hypothetical protein
LEEVAVGGVRRCEQEGVRRPRSPDAVGGPVTPAFPRCSRGACPFTGAWVPIRQDHRSAGGADREGRASPGAGALARHGRQGRGHRCLDFSRAEKGAWSFISPMSSTAVRLHHAEHLCHHAVHRKDTQCIRDYFRFFKSPNLSQMVTGIACFRANFSEP